MITLLILFSCVLTFAVIAYCAIPGHIRTLIAENCCDSKGIPQTRYLYKEGQSLTNFFGELLFWAILLAIGVIAILPTLDEYLGLRILAEAVSRADLDSDQWRSNLQSPPGNVGQDYLNHLTELGASEENARFSIHLLWHAFPIAIVTSFAVITMCLHVTSKQYGSAVRSLEQREQARNMRRIRRRYLQSSSQPRQQHVHT